MGNIAPSNLPGHGANNQSQSNQSFMFRSGDASWDMLTTGIGWTNAPTAIHIHDISASTTLAVTGNLRSESMATGEQECSGWSNTGHWKFIWSTTSVNTARCSKWIDVNNMGMGTCRYLP